MYALIIGVAAAVDAFAAGIFVGQKWGTNGVAAVEQAVAKEADVIVKHNPQHIADAKALGGAAATDLAGILRAHVVPAPVAPVVPAPEAPVAVPAPVAP